MLTFWHIFQNDGQHFFSFEDPEHFITLSVVMNLQLDNFVHSKFIFNNCKFIISVNNLLDQDGME